MALINRIKIDFTRRPKLLFGILLFEIHRFLYERRSKGIAKHCFTNTFSNMNSSSLRRVGYTNSLIQALDKLNHALFVIIGFTVFKKTDMSSVGR